MNIFAASGISCPLSLKCRLHENTDYTIALLKRLHRVGVKVLTIHVCISLCAFNALVQDRSAFCCFSLHLSKPLLNKGRQGGRHSFGKQRGVTFLNPSDVAVCCLLIDYVCACCA